MDPKTDLIYFVLQVIAGMVVLGIAALVIRSIIQKRKRRR